RRQEGEAMTPSEAARLVRELYDAVWSGGDLSGVERLVAPRYVIHSDPGDPWEGRALDHAAYPERLLYSRAAFPDLTFTVHDVVAAEGRVAVPRARTRATSPACRRPAGGCASPARRSMTSRAARSPATGR